MNLDYAKKALIEFQKEHEGYLDKEKSYQDWKNLPFWKKWLTQKVEAPNRNCLYRRACIISNSHLLIELRMYFANNHKEIKLAVNENNCAGYMLNVNTKEKTFYLGRVSTKVSEDTEKLLEEIRQELAPLYVELVQSNNQ